MHLALVARAGSYAPGTPTGVNYDGFWEGLSLNNAGQVAFVAYLAGNGVDATNFWGLWLTSPADPNVPVLVTRGGSQAPGTPAGVNFQYFFAPAVLNNAGQTAVYADLAGSGVDDTNNRGIWLGAGGSLSLVTRMGDQAPGAAPGVTFGLLGAQSLNDAGQIAFPAYLAGSGVDETNNRGIWATDTAGILQLIARTGDLLEVAPGDLRTIDELSMHVFNGSSDGRPSAFNNLGQLVFAATFTDGSQGVFVSNAVAHLPGDFNDDGSVDAADYVFWRKTGGTQDGYNTWRANFGPAPSEGWSSGGSGATESASIPEPAGLALAATGLVVLISIGQGRPHQSTRRNLIQWRSRFVNRKGNCMPRFARRLSKVVVLSRSSMRRILMNPKKRISVALIGILALSSQSVKAEPPFWGTIFIDPDIITASDPTTFEGLTYAGQGFRWMYDRRVNNWTYVNAYLFNASFDDGLTAEIQVNPEFGSSNAALTEAQKYGAVIGRLPTALRADVQTVWIHQGTQPFGGGNNNLLIHTGQADLYAADGILEETFVHEASHTSLDAAHAASSGWLAAQAADGEFISNYARDYPNREDIAESFLPYFAVRYQLDRISQSLAGTILQTIPNRASYFEAQEFDMYPFVAGPLGDYNDNGTVDAADYVVWRKNGGSQDGYNLWRANFGRTAGSGSALPSAEPLSAAVPEPATLLLYVSCFWTTSIFAFRKPWRDRSHPRRLGNTT